MYVVCVCTALCGIAQKHLVCHAQTFASSQATERPRTSKTKLNNSKRDYCNVQICQVPVSPRRKACLKRYNLCREPVYNSNKGRSNKNSQSLDRKKEKKKKETKNKTWTKSGVLFCLQV